MALAKAYLFLDVLLAGRETDWSGRETSRMVTTSEDGNSGEMFWKDIPLRVVDHGEVAFECFA